MFGNKYSINKSCEIFYFQMVSEEKSNLSKFGNQYEILFRCDDFGKMLVFSMYKSLE